MSKIRGDDDHVMATAWVEVDGRHTGALVRFNRQQANSAYEVLATFYEAAFLNGITELSDGVFLMAGSATGNIWFYDANQKISGIWYHGELTTPPNVGIPGINGIQVLDNRVYFSNTGRMLVGTITINANGSAGQAKTHTQNVLLDDFALANDGTLYGATHKDEVIKISADGSQVTIIGQYDQGVTGATAVTWENDSKQQLLVTTNGGFNHALFGKGKSSVVPAKLVRLYPNQ